MHSQFEFAFGSGLIDPACEQELSFSICLLPELPFERPSADRVGGGVAKGASTRCSAAAGTENVLENIAWSKFSRRAAQRSRTPLANDAR